MEAANIYNFQEVHVLNVTNGQRLITYAIPADKNSGEICINGAAAHLVSKGDLVIIVAYGIVDENDVEKYIPHIVHVNEKNELIA